MKYFLISLIFAVSVIAQNTSDQNVPTQDLEQLFEYCILTTKVDREIAHQARRHDLTFNDPRGNCFLKCICSNTGFCDSELKLVTKFLEQSTEINGNKIRQSGIQCSSIIGNDDCETVFRRFKCFFENVPETPVH